MSVIPAHHLHKSILLVLIILILMAAAGCDSDDDPVTGVTRADISGLVRSPDGDAAAGAAVYLGLDPQWFPMSATVVIDSTAADERGRFEFDQLDQGTYRVFSGVWDRGGQGYSLVSPFCDPLEVGEKGAGHFERLSLREIADEGSVKGEVVHELMKSEVPADSASVMLVRYEGMNFVPAGETETDAAGGFLLSGISTGNYAATAMKIFEPDAPYPLYMSAESDAFFCDGKNRVVLEKMVLRDVMVEKPAVYIYPDQAGRFRVDLAFGSGFRLAASEPPYGDGWDVHVDAAGVIDGTWDYLFYEIAMRGAPRIPTGWCLPWADLMEHLDSITAELGLNDAERDDFLRYWRSRLPRREFYEIAPVMGADLDSWVELRVDPAPDSVLRFWLFFRGRDDAVALPPPAVPVFERSGTTVVEWGGAVRS